MKRKFGATLGAALLLLLSAMVFIHSALPTPSHVDAKGVPTVSRASAPYGITVTGAQFVNPAVANDYAHNLHVNWVRIQIYMCALFPVGSANCNTTSPVTNVDPSNPGNYDWTVFDKDLVNAQANGLFVDFPLQRAPAGSFNGSSFQDPSCLQPTKYVFQQYAKALLAHIQTLLSQGTITQGVVRAIEIGNEDWSFSSQGTSCENNASVYAPIVETVTSTIRKNDTFMTPAPLIGTFGYTHFGLVNSPKEPAARNVHTFWTTFFQYRDPTKPGDLGPGRLLDFVNFHYYHDNFNPDVVISPTPSSMYPNGQDSFADVYQEILQDAQTLKVTNHSKQPMPIWVTETGWAITKCNQPSATTVTPNDQALFEQDMEEEARLSNATAIAGRGAVTHLFLFTADEYSVSCGDNGMDITDRGTPQPEGTILPGYIQSHPSWP